jgi:hypothetical protein
VGPRALRAASRCGLPVDPIVSGAPTAGAHTLRESTALVLGVRQERVASPVNLLAIRFALGSDRRG